MRISCLLLGHQINYQTACPRGPVDIIGDGRSGINTLTVTQPSGALRICSCRKSIVPEAITRIRHVLGCFLAGHDYVFVGSRHRHQEYRCVDCGHPLLFREEANPYGVEQPFRKKVRYLCNLFGHKVHHVNERQSVHEYACDCGHTFLKAMGNIKKITHPLICLFAGHFVKQICRRNDLSELLCGHCGHTFLLECHNGQ
jgi:hypothetical protein